MFGQKDSYYQCYNWALVSVILVNIVRLGWNTSKIHLKVNSFSKSCDWWGKCWEKVRLN